MIIGLTGYAQSGKDTVAKILTEHYGFERIAFADKIREFLYEMNPSISGLHLKAGVDLYGWDMLKQDPKVRGLLQGTGVAARTVFGENHWVVEAFKDLDLFDKNYVVTDVRFLNEAEWIKAMYDGQIWRVKRSGVGAVNGHESESQMDGYSIDQIISNNGSLEDLEELVKSRMVGLVA